MKHPRDSPRGACSLQSVRRVIEKRLGQSLILSHSPAQFRDDHCSTHAPRPSPPRTPQKGDPHPALVPCPTNPTSGSFLEWEMLCVRIPHSRCSRQDPGTYPAALLTATVPGWDNEPSPHCCSGRLAQAHDREASICTRAECQERSDTLWLGGTRGCRRRGRRRTRDWIFLIIQLDNVFCDIEFVEREYD